MTIGGISSGTNLQPLGVVPPSSNQVVKNNQNHDESNEIANLLNSSNNNLTEAERVEKQRGNNSEPKVNNEDTGAGHGFGGVGTLLDVFA